MNYNFSDRMLSLQPSAIREILKATSSPDVIPLAAGNPSESAFPISEVREISKKIFEENPVPALQYGITEGYTPLREKIMADMKKRHNIGRDFDDIIITTGAQQTMDLSSKVFLNEGDTVVCENPSFIGSLNCFRSYMGNLCGIEVESDGMNIEALEKALQTQKKAKFIYTIPNFQNPSGVTMSLEKRKAIYTLAKKYGIMILEDNPYGELRVAGENIPSIKSMDEDGIVIYAGSFSKILAPGIRVGYTIAPKTVISKMVVGKQTNDVHTTMFSQLLVDRWMEEYDMVKHIDKIKDIYRKKLNLMCDLIDEHLGDFVSYVRPEGGLFVWCKIEKDVDMLDFVKAAVERKVAVVPGTAFVTDESMNTQCFRMNFTTPSDEKIMKGLEILGEVKREFMHE